MIRMFGIKEANHLLDDNIRKCNRIQGRHNNDNTYSYDRGISLRSKL